MLKQTGRWARFVLGWSGASISPFSLLPARRPGLEEAEKQRVRRWASYTLLTAVLVITFVYLARSSAGAPLSAYGSTLAACKERHPFKRSLSSRLPADADALVPAWASLTTPCTVFAHPIPQLRLAPPLSPDAVPAASGSVTPHPLLSAQTPPSDAAPVSIAQNNGQQQEDHRVHPHGARPNEKAARPPLSPPLAVQRASDGHWNPNAAITYMCGRGCHLPRPFPTMHGTLCAVRPNSPCTY